jgi:hypothetical protein
LDIAVKHALETAKKNYDAVIGGSTWCADAMRTAGFPNVSAVLQGVDTRIFILI